MGSQSPLLVAALEKYAQQAGERFVSLGDSSGPYNSVEESFDPDYFDALYTAQDNHFWSRAHRRVVAAMVRRIKVALPAGYRVLEVGCGTGNVLRVLEDICRDGVVVGLDLFLEGLLYARRCTSCYLIQADIQAPPFRSRFDLVCLFDVLEHLKDDVRVLRNIGALLSPGGVLLLTVPAHRWLWSYYDEAVHHCRRYGPDELRRKLTDGGYRVEYLTYYMAATFPALGVWRRFARILAWRSPHGRGKRRMLVTRELSPGVLLNGVVSLLLAPEACLVANRWALPFGSSLLAMCRKD